MESFYLDLDYLDLILVSGKDNGKFLQGQLTCDVDAIEELQSCSGAACNNKGRVFSSFRLSKLNENIYLEMQPGLQNEFKSALDKFIPFYQAQIADGRTHFNRIGLAGTDCLAALANIFPELPTENKQYIMTTDHYLLRLSESPPRFILWSSNKQDPSILFPNMKPGQKEDWEKLDFDAGIYPLQPSDINQYTPEELNLDIQDAVSFTKGCYTGQEIVARMHYRGKAKKRLYLLQINSQNKVEIGDAIYNEEQSRLGIILKLLKLSPKTIHQEKNDTVEYLAFAILKNQQITANNPSLSMLPSSHSASILSIEGSKDAIVTLKG